MRTTLATAALLAILGRASAAGKTHEVVYPPSADPKELQFGVTYIVWIPDTPRPLRGVIVHQHGCGSGACKGGATAAFDLHWQALAAKWDCALLGPSYHQEDKQNCRLWCDPRNGSEKAFLKGLADLAGKAKRPELATVPWCLWGHSGGGFWASLMQTKHPERIVAIWLRSGTAFGAWEKGDVPRPEIPEAAYKVPTMSNPGGKEKDDKRFATAWTGGYDMFRAYRAKGALFGFAPDPRTAHECGDSRYLAIPFFDACLEGRLPKNPGDKLRDLDGSKAWLAAPLSDAPVAAGAYKGNPQEAVWLPNEATAKAWAEYVRTGAVPDASPPPAPTGVAVAKVEGGGVEVRWSADADFESGLAGFVVVRDGKEIAKLPEKAIGRFGRALFQTMSYHDTPERPMPAMRFVDAGAAPGAEYRVLSINSVGLRSAPSVGAKAP